MAFASTPDGPAIHSFKLYLHCHKAGLNKASTNLHAFKHLVLHLHTNNQGLLRPPRHASYMSAVIQVHNTGLMRFRSHMDIVAASASLLPSLHTDESCMYKKVYQFQKTNRLCTAAIHQTSPSSPSARFHQVPASPVHEHSSEPQSTVLHCPSFMPHLTILTIH